LRAATLPPLFALAGVALLRLDLPHTATLLVAVTLGLAALQAFDTQLAPALSAAALPIVFDVRAWSYPLAVLAVSLVVSAGMGWLPRDHPRLARLCAVSRPVAPGGRYGWSIIGGAWLAIGAWIVVGGELLALSSVVLTPPLFVSALEWLGRGTLSTREGARRWTLLVGAGLGGSAALALVPVAWVAGAIAIAVTLVLMVVLATPHPPALAVGLIPQIVDTASPLSFTLAIAAGAGALYAGVYVVSRVADLARAIPQEARPEA
jgi:hypothetical protein